MPDVLPIPARIDPSRADAPAPATPLLYSAHGLTAVLSLGLRTIRTMDAAGKLPAPIRIGGAVRWRADEIRDWLAAGAPDRATWAAIRAARK